VHRSGGFNEYRFTHEISHLQTLSMYGLPFALLGFPPA